jgi:hypothetical protein
MQMQWSVTTNNLVRFHPTMPSSRLKPTHQSQTLSAPREIALAGLGGGFGGGEGGSSLDMFLGMMIRRLATAGGMALLLR